MDTEALKVLVNTVSAGSIAAAARRLELAPVVASRRLAGLERELGVRLLHRTTRSVALTPEGEDFLPYAREILDREAAAVSALAPGEAGAVGLLRATAPASLGREVIIPMLPALFAANPQLRLELHLAERLVDLVGEGLDVAIRIADLKDSRLVARRVGTVRRIVCAAPDYLARRGRPTTVAELAAHDCLTLVGAAHWAFDGVGGVQRVRVGGRLTCSAIDGVHEACRQGLGIAMLADWTAGRDLATGRLEALPLDAPPHAPPISALYPSARMAPPKLRVFLAALTEALAGKG
jgi:DNA-binding transcriptional LysR family regulator